MAAAEAGCRLCAMIWYQVPAEVRRLVQDVSAGRHSGPSAMDALDEDGPVLYTVSELLGRDGRYTVEGQFAAGTADVSYSVDFIRIEGEPIEGEFWTAGPGCEFSNAASECSRTPQAESQWPQSLQLIEQWLSVCLRSHAQCQRPRRAVNKFARILDVGLGGQSTIVRLLDHDDVPLNASYVTISHCWGSREITMLRRENLAQFKNSIDMEILPATFQDSINLVRQLGVRYVWIDSLCIVQDDPEDWRGQAAVMADVYHGSWLNVAATAAQDGTDGLFGFLTRFPACLQRFQVEITHGSSIGPRDLDQDDDASWTFDPHPRENETWHGIPRGRYECIDRLLWYRNVTDSPIGHRAWIVQERLLAPRVLHFAASQLFWECNQLKACELYPTGLPDRADLQSTSELKCIEVTDGFPYPEKQATSTDWNDTGPAPRILRSWHDTVQVYTKANLTFERDKLVAIAGLAQAYANRIKADYLAGLWGVHLHRQLLWAIRDPVEAPKEARAPSWSWASVHGQVWPVVGIDDVVQQRLATVLDFSVTGNMLGYVGCLSMQGRLIPCSLSYDPTARTNERCNPTVRGLEKAAFVQMDTISPPGNGKPCSFFCLPTVIFFDATEPSTPEVAGLVLQSTGEKGTFRRFGAFRTDNAMDRDGDRHWNWIHDDKAQPRVHTQFGRVFLAEADDESSEVAEQFYLQYETDVARRGFSNFVFNIV